MSENPMPNLLMIAAGGYISWLWWEDYRQRRATGRDNPQALPGATPAPVSACVIAAAGALVILALETWGEIRLGISDEQSSITVLFGLYSLVAAVIEEIIFRGYIVVTKRGTAVQWLAAVGASVVFAALHPFLWDFETGDHFWAVGEWVWTWQLTLKGWFSTALVFLSSIWFYTVRFAGFNPHKSLLPCFAAHGAKNLGVFVIKAMQGFVHGVF
ncbi:MAG: CPBP family intramembrane glutamic endopeptidase [Verrucomicrobiota bacterium]